MDRRQQPPLKADAAGCPDVSCWLGRHWKHSAAPPVAEAGASCMLQASGGCLCVCCSSMRVTTTPSQQQAACVVPPHSLLWSSHPDSGFCCCCCCCREIFKRAEQYVNEYRQQVRTGSTERGSFLGRVEVQIQQCQDRQQWGTNHQHPRTAGSSSSRHELLLFLSEQRPQHWLSPQQRTAAAAVGARK